MQDKSENKKKKTLAEHEAENKLSFEQTDLGKNTGKFRMSNGKTIGDIRKERDASPEKARNDYNNSALGKSLSDTGLGEGWSSRTNEGDSDKNKSDKDGGEKKKKTLAEHEEEMKLPFEDTAYGKSMDDFKMSNGRTMGEMRKERDADPEKAKNDYNNSALGKSLNGAGLGEDWSNRPEQDDAGGEKSDGSGGKKKTLAEHEAENKLPFEQTEMGKSTDGLKMSDGRSVGEMRKERDADPEKAKNDYNNSALGKSMSDAGLGGDWSEQSSVKQDNDSTEAEEKKKKESNESVNNAPSQEDEGGDESPEDSRGKSKEDVKNKTTSTDKNKDGTEKKSDDLAANLEGANQVADEIQGLSGAADAAIMTLGWSEIGRVLLRIICAQVPMLAQIGKKFPKLDFYFRPITLSSWLDIIQLIVWLLLVIIWGIILVIVFILVFVAVYCSQPENYIQCGVAAVKAMT